MSRPMERSSSYYKAVAGRGREIYFVVLIVIIIIVSTVTIVTLRNFKLSLSEKCGPGYGGYSVDITGAEETAEGGYVSEGITYPRGTFWKSDSHIFGCPCAVKPCIRKCCGRNEEYYNAEKNSTETKLGCIESNRSFIISERGIFSRLDFKEMDVEDTHFYVFYGKPCKLMYMKSPEDYEDEEHYLMEDGEIYSPQSISPFIDQTQYCFESTIGNNGTIDTYACLPVTTETSQEEQEKWTFDATLLGMFVSIPCLVCTFVVYAILPKKNLHNKCLMCHVASLTIAYATLASVQFPETVIKVGHPSCVVAGFLLQFSLLASFFWLNSMCFDIWWVFSGRMSLKGSTERAQLKKFVLYSLYSWGAPLLIVAITAFMEYAPWVPSYLVKPGFGVDRCWFFTFDARILFLYLPIGVLITVNVVLFSTTSCRLRLGKKNTDQLQTSDSKVHNVSDRHRFNLYLNLFIVMGVTWVMELLSFAIGGSRIYWIISDLTNALQGVFIFLIFVCKRRILRQVNRRLCPGMSIFGPTSSMKDSSRTFSSRLSSYSLMKLRRTSNDV